MTDETPASTALADRLRDAAQVTQPVIRLDGTSSLQRRGGMQLVLHSGCLSTSFPAWTRQRRVSDQRLMAANSGAAKTCIVGLGDPIVDVLVKLSAQNFDQLGLQRGGSVSLHTSEIDDLLEQVTDDGHRTRSGDNDQKVVSSDVLNLSIKVFLCTAFMEAVQQMY